MKKKRVLGFLTVAATALVIAGCDNSGKKEDGTATRSGGGDENVTNFKIATVRWADWGTDFLDGFIKESEKEAGITVDWDVYVNSDWADKKSVLLAGGDLPDAFLGSIALNDAEIAQNQAMFIPLEDLIEENMPNLKAAFEKDPTLKALVTSPDGHIYSLPKKAPMRPLIGNQLFINQKWLDNLSLDMPDTTDEFIEVLKAFKEKDANGNGDTKDEIPFGAGNFDPTYSFIMPFNNRLGADNTYNMTVKEGKAVYMPVEKDYREGIAFMHDAYKEGLIDSEIFTQDSSMSDAKRMNAGESLVGVSSGWTADATFGEHASEYVALPALKGPDGNRYVTSDPEHYNYSRNELMITTANKNPGLLLKWADQFYTDDASIQTFYGSFGVGVEKDGDKYKVLPPQDGESADSWAWINSLRDFGPKFVEEGFNDRVEIDKTSGDGLKLELDKELREYAIDAFPNVNYSTEELNKLSSIFIDISSYVSQMTSKWVVEGGIDTEWDDYLAQLDKMGYQDFIKIQEEAYARHLKAMK